MKASAHTHTLYSDGNQTHMEIMHEAEVLGLTDVVFSDHDLLIPDEVMPQLKNYNGPVAWHSGIELTTYYSPRPLAKGGTIHLLGIGVNRTHPKLTAYCKQLQAERSQTMHNTVAHLQSLGFDVTVEKVLEKAGKGSIASPHTVQALELDTHSANRAVHDRLLHALEKEAQKGTRKNVQKLWQDYQDGGPKQEPYVLYMKNYSFRPARGSTHNSMVGLKESVELIREAGGKAILAHWFFNKVALPLDQLEQLIKEHYFDGLETSVVNTISQNNIQADVQTLQNLATAYGLSTIASGDSHSAEDMTAFAESPHSLESSEALAVFLRN